MTDRPIIFSAPMVRALLDGRKSQTRRVLGKTGGRVNIFNPETAWSDSYVLDPGNAEWRAKHTPYAPGDRLYVREACHLPKPGVAHLMYRADHPDAVDIRWRPSIHMPRWASRITLTVTEVRVQRLQEISAADVLAEGCPLDPFYHDTTADGSNPHMVKIDTAKWISPRGWYHRLWNSLHGPDAWDANPWVVAVTFSTERRNIDAI